MAASAATPATIPIPTDTARPASNASATRPASAPTRAATITLTSSAMLDRYCVAGIRVRRAPYVRMIPATSSPCPVMK